MKPRFFRSPAGFRAWLSAHHASAREVVVGYWKKETGRPSLTWPESVDEALCFGWIDGIRRRHDERSYTVRFTPRRPGSRWSAVNIRRAKALIAGRRMRPAGRAAFERHRSHPGSGYSVSSRPDRFPGPLARALRRHRAAHAFFEAQPPSYRKMVISWVTGAKREETRRRRFARLVADSAAGRRLGQATRYAGREPAAGTRATPGSRARR